MARAARPLPQPRPAIEHPTELHPSLRGYRLRPRRHARPAGHRGKPATRPARPLPVRPVTGEGESTGPEGSPAAHLGERAARASGSKQGIMHEYQGQQIVRRSWARRTGFTLAWLFLLAAAAAAVIATYGAGAGSP